jgi:hypothetical protein
MQFLADLDGLTFFLTGLSIVFVLVFLVLLWVSYEGRWPRESAGVPVALLALTVFCSVHAYTAYCPDADQPHIRRTGTLTPFRTYRYAVGKHSYRVGILECVGLCGNGVPLMEFNATATALIRGRNPSIPFTVTYLGRREQADIWNGYRITAHPVVEIDDSTTGDRLLYVDTTRHWPRVIVLLADGFLCILTFVFCMTRTESGSAEQDGSSDEPARRSVPIPDTLTGLGLDHDDQTKS